MFSVIAPPSMQSVLRGLRSSQLYSLSGASCGAPAGLFPVATREFSTKLKPARDPERPKLPLTPYMLYLHQFRQSPPAGMNGLEVLRSAGQTWKSLGDHDKAPFMRTYQANKAVYTAEFEKYKASGKLEAWKRDPSRPKRPLTGYMRYAKEWRARHGSGLKVTEVTKKASVAWKSLPEDQQAIYNNAYKNEKAKYDAAMADYKASGKEQAFKEKTGLAAAEQKVAEKKMKMKMKAAAVVTRKGSDENEEDEGREGSEGASIAERSGKATVEARRPR
ncbi:unnamed protein product [Amoebophrya sp. A25]|nr:unnamed protein product [Amoebophrya sp. A25]|eukprot:GSA25T00013553001.1